ncbi:hypothetical protein TIFTF001_020554 [Ficus carica]|uniref:TIR domain-containing protein n=1 Tax=Ficus carica TaxID=3494 RepID=A0AA88DJM3_FICCA|nr:hypothetical protein TIFTF001_020554 [Ficus carica]
MAASSSSVLAWKKRYHVFISFRGEDTRNTFVSHLYSAFCSKKIKAYIDEESLSKGDEISPALKKGIQELKISVVVLSENYASSSSCLNELGHILDCKEMDEQIVVPVFYHVDPSHVRKQQGSYATAFAKYEQHLNKDEMMNDVQCKNGWIRCKNGGMLWQHAEKLEYLTGERDWLGPGSSKIIITTRDAQVLRNIDAHKIYKELSGRVLNHAQGIPLALKVLGHHLCSKSTRVWESALEKLKEAPNAEIQKKWVGKSFVENLKSLESAAGYGLLAKDTYHVLKNYTGTEVIQGMSLNMSELRNDIYLDPRVFEEMCNLKFLQFINHYGCTKKLYLPQGLHCLPDELRYLRWDYYPLKSLPLNFTPQNLVEQYLQNSQRESLFKEIQHFDALKIINPSGSRRLEKFPELPRNISKLNMQGTAIEIVPHLIERLSLLKTFKLAM